MSITTTTHSVYIQHLPPVLSSLCADYTFQNYQDYYMDRTLRSSGQYYEDEKCGLWTYYYPNGALKAQGHWEDDEKIGEWTVWSQDGVLTRIMYKKGA